MCNFAIFQRVCMKLCMETLNVKTFSFSLFRRGQKPKFIVLSHFLMDLHETLYGDSKWKTYDFSELTGLAIIW